MTHTLRHISKGRESSVWSGEWIHYLYSFYPIFFVITFTYHDVMTCIITSLTIRIRKSRVYIFEIPGCAFLFLYLSKWTFRRQCWLRLSSPSAVTSAGTLSKKFYPRPHCGCHYAWWIYWCVLLEGWLFWGVLGLNPECLDIARRWW